MENNYFFMKFKLTESLFFAVISRLYSFESSRTVFNTEDTIIGSVCITGTNENTGAILKNKRTPLL